MGVRRCCAVRRLINGGYVCVPFGVAGPAGGGVCWMMGMWVRGGRAGDIWRVVGGYTGAWVVWSLKIRAPDTNVLPDVATGLVCATGPGLRRAFE